MFFYVKNVYLFINKYQMLIFVQSKQIILKDRALGNACHGIDVSNLDVMVI
jgi:hypothetical protein